MAADATPATRRVKHVHEKQNSPVIRYQVVTKVCYLLAMILGNLTIKREPDAFRGIVVGLLLSIPLWLAIATMSWNFYGLAEESNQPKMAQIEKSPSLSDLISGRQEPVDNSPQ